MFKDLVVHADATDQGSRRIVAAATLARALDAHLTGLYVIPPDPVPAYAPGVMGTLESTTVAQVEGKGANAFREQRDDAKRTFESVIERVGISGGWHDSEGPIAGLVSVYGRLADLVIVGQDAEETEPAQPLPGLAAEVALEAGRPTLVIPNAGEWKRIGTRVMVAWRATREATRALHDALPFLHRAEEVTILTVRHGAQEDEPSEAELDIAAHLTKHGINAEWEHASSELDVPEELLSRMADMSCDLLVMGAYGHSRLREFVFGGTTRHMLEHMTAPVLLSN